MAFVSQYLTLDVATNLVNERTNTPKSNTPKGRGPLWAALKEGAIQAELVKNGQPLDPSWWINPPIWWCQSSGGIGTPGAETVRVRREDVDRLWPPVAAAAQNTAAQSQSALPRAVRSAAGAKGLLDWEPVLIEAARFMYERQEAGSQTALFEHLRKWLDRSDGGPAESTLKEHVAPLWRAFKQIDDGG